MGRDRPKQEFENVPPEMTGSPEKEIHEMTNPGDLPQIPEQYDDESPTNRDLALKLATSAYNAPPSLETDIALAQVYATLALADEVKVLRNTYVAAQAPMVQNPTYYASGETGTNLPDRLARGYVRLEPENLEDYAGLQQRSARADYDKLKEQTQQLRSELRDALQPDLAGAYAEGASLVEGIRRPSDPSYAAYTENISAENMAADIVKLEAEQGDERGPATVEQALKAGVNSSDIELTGKPQQDATVVAPPVEAAAEVETPETEPAPKPRRKRRTKAEMEAARMAELEAKDAAAREAAQGATASTGDAIEDSVLAAVTEGETVAAAKDVPSEVTMNATEFLASLDTDAQEQPAGAPKVSDDPFADLGIDLGATDTGNSIPTSPEPVSEGAESAADEFDLLAASTYQEPASDAESVPTPDAQDEADLKAETDVDFDFNDLLGDNS